MRSKGRYTLDEFWRVKMDLELPGKTIQVRSLGDWEVQERARQVVLARITAKKEMEEGSMRQAIEDEIADSNKEDMIAVLCLFRFKEARENEYQKTHPRIVIIPDKATDAEMEEAIADREQAIKDWEEKNVKAAEAQVEAYRKSLEKYSLENLRKETLKARIKAQGELAAYRTAEDYTIFFCAQYQGKPFFVSVEDAKNCNAQIKQEILDAHDKVGGVDIHDMENFFVTDSSTEPS